MAEEKKQPGADSVKQENAEYSNGADVFPTDMIAISRRFAALNKLIRRDLNSVDYAPIFPLYKKDNIQKYLTNPYRFEKQLRKAVMYIYGASSHFRRLIQYFVGLSDLSYIVEAYKIDPRKANSKTVSGNYRKVLNLLSSMSIKTQFPKILTVCLREDVFYGTLWITPDSVTIQQLPSDFCAITTIEGNVFNVEFDFSYFDRRPRMLPFFPAEFKTKYQIYLDSKKQKRWIELDAPNSFAIKCNNDILEYAIPPFAGLLREIYEIEDYASMKATKEALENYAILAMKLPLNDDGDWGIDLKKAKEFWGNLDAVLPEEVGSVLTPMDLTKISFERSNTSDVDTVADAEQHLFTAAGVSSLLFNNAKASANALLLSIKADQAITYGIVKSLQDMVNRLIQSMNYGKSFKVNFLDCSPYNRKEVGEAYLKAATYGLPTVCAYAASQGIGQAELDSMSFLENDVLKIHDIFKPLINSSQMSSEQLEEGNGATDEGGAPQKEIGDLTDSGEQSREDSDDW